MKFTSLLFCFLFIFNANSQEGKLIERKATEKDYSKAKKIILSTGIDPKNIKDLSLEFTNDGCEFASTDDGPNLGTMLITFYTTAKATIMDNSVGAGTFIKICDEHIDSINISRQKDTALNIQGYKCSNVQFDRMERLCHCTLKADAEVEGKSLNEGSTVYLRGRKPYGVLIPKDRSSKNTDEWGIFVIRDGKWIKGEDKQVGCFAN